MTNVALDTPTLGAPSRASMRDWTVLLVFALTGLALRYAVSRLGLNGGSFTDFVDSLCRWDCGWYESVARGYDVAPQWRRGGEANWAFFPLYPLLAGSVQSLTGLTWAMAGFLVSNLLGVVAAGAVRPLFGSDRAYWLFAFSLLLGPFSYLFSLPYSESLFILLTILALRSLHRSDYVTAGLWGALLSATRVTGLLIGAAILAQAIQDRLREGTSLVRLPLALLSDRRLILAGLLVPVGLIVFMLHLRFVVGDGLAFSHVQMAWGRTIGNPINNWVQVIGQGWPFRPYFGTATTHAWLAGIGMALSVVLAVRGRWAAAVFCLAAILLSLSAGLTSMTRFVAGLAPLGIPVAEMVARWRWVAWLAYPVSLALGLGMAAGWLLDWSLLI